LDKLKTTNLKQQTQTRFVKMFTLFLVSSGYVEFCGCQLAK